MTLSDKNILWNNCLKVIRDNISEKAFDVWFSPIVPLEYDKENKALTVQIPSPFFYEIIEDKFINLIQKTLHREIGKGATLKYKVIVENEKKTSVEYATEPKPIHNPKTATKSDTSVPSPFKRKEAQEFNSQINTKYNFSNYYEGDSNRLARTASETVAKNPGTTAFNPLFIHGHSGVGKTHLCHAIGSSILENYPEKKVLYVSAHLFKLQFTDAKRHNTINDFLNFYQSIDVLIIDDIQEFSGLIKTQNTFFNIFNHLHQNKKQLILTADRSPAEMEGVEDRLLSRFRWGLSAELQRPDKELRKKILLNKIKADGLNFPDDVIEYVAENATQSVRDIEGVVVSLMAHAVITNRDVDIALAKRVLEQTIRTEKKNISVHEIQNTVCGFFKIKKELLQTTSRKREIVQARQIAMYFTKIHTELSLSQIGLEIGKRNHATVLHACKIVKDQLEVDKSFRTCIEEIEKLIVA